MNVGPLELLLERFELFLLGDRGGAPESFSASGLGPGSRRLRVGEEENRELADLSRAFGEAVGTEDAKCRRTWEEQSLLRFALLYSLKGSTGVGNSPLSLMLFAQHSMRTLALATPNRARPSLRFSASSRSASRSFESPFVMSSCETRTHGPPRSETERSELVDGVATSWPLLSEGDGRVRGRVKDGGGAIGEGEVVFLEDDFLDEKRARNDMMPLGGRRRAEGLSDGGSSEKKPEKGRSALVLGQFIWDGD